MGTSYREALVLELELCPVDSSNQVLTSPAVTPAPPIRRSLFWAERFLSKIDMKGQFDWWPSAI